MSRVGKKPISIPAGVEVKIEGSAIEINGPKGQLKKELRPEIKIEMKDKEILVSVLKETKKSSAFWGLTRALVFNMIKGVTE